MGNVKIDTVKIGSHIVKLRKEQHLTQEELGNIIHISSTHISTVENGGSYSLNTLISICDGLNARLDYVLYGNIRDNDIDNLIDLLNLCSEKEILILEAVAKTLIENREK
ncbi:MAG: helix-turn-helix transcriptional regulator [Erysipelotrichaceae bacterium]|nr:helix-turn-helix transcriptional regulator [Erysipelotrichaceae bacterium]